jgi:hypothetical protein
MAIKKKLAAKRRTTQKPATKKSAGKSSRKSSARKSPAKDIARQLLRHTVATLAYRAGKTLRGAPDSFATFSTGENGRTPLQILAHMGDLFDWALATASGNEKWNNATPLPWAQESERFFSTLQAFDDYLASKSPLAVPAEKLLQGPIADALTHTGQLAILRRMSGSKMRGENYFRAEITAGRVGPDQAAPVREF